MRVRSKEEEGEETLIKCFRNLFHEFDDWVDSGNQIIVKGGITISGIKHELVYSKVHENHKSIPEIFESLHSYGRLNELMKAEVKLGADFVVNPLGLALYLFPMYLNELFRLEKTLDGRLRPIGVMEYVPVDKDLLVEYLQNTVMPDVLLLDTKSYILLFNHLYVEEGGSLVEDNFELITLSDFEKSKIEREGFLLKTDTNCAIVASNFENSEDINIDAIGTSIRLFKKCKIQYIGTFRLYRNVFQGNSYRETIATGTRENTEHVCVKRQPLEIRKDEITNFKQLFNSCLSSGSTMLYSFKLFNLKDGVKPEVRLPILFFALESLFDDVDSEVTFRISLYVSKILGESAEYTSNLKLLYALRSKIAHGGGSLDKTLEKLHRSEFIPEANLDSAVDKTEDIVVRLFVKLTSENWNPANSKIEMDKILYA